MLVYNRCLERGNDPGRLVAGTGGEAYREGSQLTMVY
jgi:hypothetical protein